MGGEDDAAVAVECVRGIGTVSPLVDHGCEISEFHKSAWQNLQTEEKKRLLSIFAWFIINV
jgi:hypothetical protein